MSARTWDTGLGVAFVALGVGVSAAAWQLPAGVAGIPGPGVFPFAVGMTLAALGTALALHRPDRHRQYWQRSWRDPAIAQIVVILALLAAFVLLWDVLGFVPRTLLLLLAIYRVLGEPWLRAGLVAVGVTLVLAGVFDLVFRVRL